MLKYYINKNNNNLIKPKLIDHLFWIFLIFFTDPGGLIKYQSQGKLYIQFVIFIILLLLFISLPKKQFLNYNNFKQYHLMIIIWVCYYILIYGILNNQSTSFMFFLKRHGLTTLMAISLSYFVYVFACRNLKLFLRYFLYSAIAVSIGFFLTYFANMEILPLRYYMRDYSTEPRIMLYNFGLLGVSIPLAIVCLYFRINISEKTFLIYTGVFMLIIWLLAMARRHLLSSILTFIITLYIGFKIKGIKIVSSLRPLVVALITLIILINYFPNYIDSAKKTFVETFSVLTTGRTTTGAADIRLSLTKQTTIINTFVHNFLLGTGYEPKWFSQEGDSMGYEASDYIFLGALAQYGLVGILLYLPIYIFLFKKVYMLYKSLRLNTSYAFTSDYDKLFIFYLIINYIIKLFNYPNYFSEVGWSINAYYNYIINGLLLAILYRQEKYTKDKILVNQT